MKATPEILDKCMDAIMAGATVSEALAPYPELKDELEPLLLMGAGLAAAPDPVLNLDSMLQNMGQAMAQPAVVRPMPRITIFSRPVLTRLVASWAIILMLGWGTTVASASAVPGDLLYPLKLVTERVRFVLAVNSEDRAELSITFSERRLVEALKKYDRGQGLDPELLADMLGEATAALESVPGLPVASRNIMAARVLSASRFQTESLKRLHAQATPQEQEVLQPYLEMCSQRCDWMQQNLDSPNKWGGCDSQESGGSDCPW